MEFALNACALEPKPMTSEARYAIYFAPAKESELERVCSSVLGRCARTGKNLMQPRLPGIEPERLAELTASPRHYGLHGTLKAPFFLAEGATEADLLGAVAVLAAGRPAFACPPLRLEAVGSFLALTPVSPCRELEALARACVTELDRYRRPPSADELARRRAKGLTVVQDSLLQRWGYPYVLEEFRFHLTLTGTIPETDERRRIQAGLAALLEPILQSSAPVTEIHVFRQPARHAPFTVLAASPLAVQP